ncbi:hypothetical protein HYPSUDRAFT_38891 [Hypholoma sublateritium FD-334 SS-4]|uniref:Uncharacterized protein n=1 Tax=Hypholoma sublateritium (strain FD-334 SS-4) TaxID=945553 RepID=A0A0D2PYG4_HYPSF|nr:hypothetical protein HYPSUDRAFT_38891 [Hypholoma sublateritium FD-334 SS-4]
MKCFLYRSSARHFLSAVSCSPPKSQARICNHFCNPPVSTLPQHDRDSESPESLYPSPPTCPLLIVFYRRPLRALNSATRPVRLSIYARHHAISPAPTHPPTPATHSSPRVSALAPTSSASRGVLY